MPFDCTEGCLEGRWDTRAPVGAIGRHGEAWEIWGDMGRSRELLEWGECGARSSTEPAPFEPRPETGALDSIDARWLALQEALQDADPRFDGPNWCERSSSTLAASQATAAPDSDVGACLKDVSWTCHGRLAEASAAPRARQLRGSTRCTALAARLTAFKAAATQQSQRMGRSARSAAAANWQVAIDSEWTTHACSQLSSCRLHSLHSLPPATGRSTPPPRARRRRAASLPHPQPNALTPPDRAPRRVPSLEPSPAQAACRIASPPGAAT